MADDSMSDTLSTVSSVLEVRPTGRDRYQDRRRDRYQDRHRDRGYGRRHLTPMASRHGSDVSSDEEPDEPKGGFKVWPENFNPVLDEKLDLSTAAKFIGKDVSPDTWVLSVRKAANPDGIDARSNSVKVKFLNEAKLDIALTNRDESTFDLIAIPECFAEDTPLVAERHHDKLVITLRSFSKLTKELGMPLNAIFSYSRNTTEVGSGFRRLSSAGGDSKQQSWDYWCLIPFRGVNECSDDDDCHYDDMWDEVTRGEFSPSKKVHLPKHRFDIEQAQFGVWVKYDAESKKSSAVVIHRENNLGFNSFKNPPVRVKEALRNEEDEGPLVVLLIYLARAVRLWGCALWEVNRQVIHHQFSIHKTRHKVSYHSGYDNGDDRDMLKGLDLLSAHLLRYVSDLARLRGILTELLERLDVMAPTNRERAEDQLKTLVAQCNSCQLLCDEVTRKVQNMTTMMCTKVSGDETSRTVRDAMQSSMVNNNFNGLNSRIDSQGWNLKALQDNSIELKRILTLGVAVLSGALLSVLSSALFQSNPHPVHPVFSTSQPQSSSTNTALWLLLAVPFVIAVYIFFPWILENLAHLERARPYRFQTYPQPPPGHRPFPDPMAAQVHMPPRDPVHFPHFQPPQPRHRGPKTGVHGMKRRHRGRRDVHRDDYYL